MYLGRKQVRSRLCAGKCQIQVVAPEIWWSKPLYGAAPLRALIAQTDDPIPVWPYEESKQRGVSLAPLYKTAPMAALRDEPFYEMLVIADALREGRTRERKIAETELHRRLQGSN